MARLTFKSALSFAFLVLLVFAYSADSTSATVSKGRTGQATVPDNTPIQLYLPMLELEQALYFVDGNSGDDNNPGTKSAPWKTVEKAIASIQPGDTVEIRAGIYRAETLRFAPAGLGSERLTTFRASLGERVIFSQPDDSAPTVYMADYTRLEGLWIGGQWTKGDENQFFFGGSPIGTGKQFINNTFFGFTQLLQGSAENILFQGNRFVLTGSGRFAHSIYLSGGYTSGSMSSHAIVDNNIFVGGEGYAIHGWHKTRNNIVTRNFVSGHYWGLVLDGSDHVVANNFFWRQTGQPGREGPFAAWLPGDRILVVNNVFAQNPSFLGIGTEVQIENNAFLNSTRLGARPRDVPPDETAVAFGVSSEQIDEAIAALESAFSVSVEEIYADPTIEPHFATLRFTIPQNSILRNGGSSWYNAEEKANIGPDASTLSTPDQFWAAFRELGFQEFDRFGEISAQP